MKKQILILALGAFALTSCEKVIDVDLDNADPKLVIEAQLTEGKQWFEVKVSESGPYFDSGLPTGIEGATIELFQDNNLITTLTDRGNGVYGDSVEAFAGNTYVLEATVDGKFYTASSTLRPKVDLLELSTEFQEAFGPVDEGYQLTFRFQDPAGEDNFYRLVYFIDGERQDDGEDLQLFDDRLDDGGTPRFSIFQQVFDEGEIVRVQLWHLDEASFDYFSALSDISGAAGGPNQGSAAPGNPISNWTGDILGYFTAYSMDEMEITVE